mgnify:CR=1 FL=1
MASVRAAVLRMAALCAIFALLLLWGLSGSRTAYGQSEPQKGAPPPQVEQLLRLLQDPAVRAWIDQQQRRAAPPAGAAPPPMASEMMTERIASLRQHLASLAAAVPRLPDEFRSAGNRLLDELQGRSPVAVLVLILGFLALGAGTEWLFRIATVSLRRRVAALPLGTTSGRLRAIGLRFALDLGGIVIFTIGSVGAFLAFRWPPLLTQVVVAYLIAVVALRLALVIGRFLLAPRVKEANEAEYLRLVPTSTEAARYWYGRLALFVGWLVFGWATVDVLSALGFTPAARAVVAYVLGIGLLAISMEIAWARPNSESGEGPQEGTPANLSRPATASLLSICFVLLWAFWVAGLTRIFWLGVVAPLLPMAIRLSERTVRHALRPPTGVESTAVSKLTTVYVERGIRALLIIGAVLLLAWAWRIDLVEMTSRDTVPIRLARGLLSGIVILLVADLIWQITKSLIDQRLARLAEMAPPGSEEALRQARQQTLLPIFRSAAFILLSVIAVMMALSALGVEIGPLIAGAGIAGVALGFGAQTLVRDVISGIFYLLDDAFRVGEYIQSGNYKGRVESLGFRSVKLRHHRGPVYTVPYGQLGAVQNMSRDWVIDKMTVNVTYDTDLEKAKKIVKQIGKDLAQDPESAPHILEPLKMQGVQQFGDFAIQIRLKMMTRPGEQFVIRRKAYAMLKKAFDENGIKFAFPTVQVAGRDEVAPAAGQQALGMLDAGKSK